MSTDDGRPVPQRLSRELQTLHRLLLQSEAAAGAISTDPYKLMRAAMGDPRLAWLNDLLKLIAAFDEDDDSGALVDPQALAAWRARIEALIGPGASEEAGFRSRYDVWLRRSPEVAEVDRRLRALLAMLPHPLSH